MRGNIWLAPCLLGTAFLAIIAGFQAVVASPQLIGVAAAQGIAPKLDTGNLPGGKRAINQARDHQATSQSRASEADKLTDENGQGFNSKVWQAADVVKEFAKDPSGASQRIEGQLLQATGVVIGVDRDGEVTVVTLAPKNARQDSPFFMFRFNTANVNFALGDEVTLEGTFVARVAGERGANDIYACDAVAKDGSVGAGGASNSTAPPQPFGGWRFTGSVVDNSGATGVFVRGSETVYAQAGDVLPGNIGIARIGMGDATLIQHGSKSLVLSW